MSWWCPRPWTQCIDTLPSSSRVAAENNVTNIITIVIFITLNVLPLPLDRFPPNTLPPRTAMRSVDRITRARHTRATTQHYTIIFYVRVIHTTSPCTRISSAPVTGDLPCTLYDVQPDRIDYYRAPSPPSFRHRGLRLRRFFVFLGAYRLSVVCLPSIWIRFYYVFRFYK